MAEILSLSDAIATHVSDGDTVALEGFTHLIPHAAGHELIRQGRRHLTAIRMTPDIVYDQLIGAGCVDKVVFSWGGNPGVGSLHRLRDAVENGWPHPIELEEYSHAMLANAFVAGASNLPFAVMRASPGTDLSTYNEQIREISCPYTGESLTTVPAMRPDVTILHAQRADRDGNVQFWGITGVSKEAALAAQRVIVTVEEIVDTLERVPEDVVLPSWAVDAVCEVPNGAHPSYADGYTERDNPFYTAWDPISRDREAFQTWLEDHVLSAAADPSPPARQDNPPGPAARTAATDFTADEMMTVTAARRLHDGQVCFVGIGIPSTAANLARLTHAPGLTLIYESGPIGAKPTVLPLSIGDGELAATADLVVPTHEIFRYWLQGGRIDVGFLGAAQIDRFGNVNTTVIGDYATPKVRLPGAGGAPEIGAHARETVLVLRHAKRAFVDQLHYVTTAGFLDGGDARQGPGFPGAGPQQVITDLGLLSPDPQTRELVLTHLHPGVALEDVREKTGWDLQIASPLRETDPPSVEELEILRELKRRTAEAHSG